MTASHAGAPPHEVLNGLPTEAARQALASCCGARRWVEAMLARRPLASTEALYAAAAEVWRGLERADFLEAFAHHPRIGERADARATAAATDTSRAWSAEEQARAARAPDEAASLGELNQQYAERFGHIFIICATGKSAAEILAALRARLPNAPEAELAIAAAEQAQITRLRLEKLAR